MPWHVESWVFMLIQYNKNSMRLELLKTGTSFLPNRKVISQLSSNTFKKYLNFFNENMKSQKIDLYHKEIVVNKTNRINDLKD
jgi:hypothetical protein